MLLGGLTAQGAAAQPTLHLSSLTPSRDFGKTYLHNSPITFRLNDTLELKSETGAVLWSVFGTLVPVGAGMATKVFLLSVAGFMIGPSLGYIYGGETGRGLTGIGIRAGIAGATVLVTYAAVSGQKGWDAFWSDLGAILIVGAIGGVAIIIDAAYDILNVGNYIKEKNDARRRLSFAISPTYSLKTGSKGIAMQIHF